MEERVKEDVGLEETEGEGEKEGVLDTEEEEEAELEEGEHREHIGYWHRTTEARDRGKDCFAS